MNPIRGTRLALAIVAGLLALAVVGWQLWSLFIHPGQQREAVAQATGQTIVAKGQVAATQDATKTTERTYEKLTRIETITRDGIAAVAAAPDDHAAADAGRRAVCMFDLYAGRPPCDVVHDAGAGEHDATDRGLADTARR